MTVELQEMPILSGDHVVQFYEEDADLFARVGEYLCSAITGGASALVIATPSHREGFDRALRAAGLHPEQCVREGRLTWFDAESTLRRFVDNGCVDRERFVEAVGAAVRKAVDAGRPVWAYGEMVSVLWEAGDVVAAIELENAWNELARELPFALVCGYRSGAFHSNHPAGLRAVCAVHSIVRGVPPTAIHELDAHASPVTADFACAARSASQARRFVAGILEAWGHSAVAVQDAKLVVSELATNAVVHADSPFSVELVQLDDGFRVVVGDESKLEPVIREPVAPVASSGRGLRLIDAIAAAWGVQPTATGKRVWAELRAVPAL